jgi:phosphoenolpyruvate carboxykinase (ATP)
MTEKTAVSERISRTLDLVNPGRIHWNLPMSALYEAAIRRGEAVLAEDGPLLVQTGRHTGRSPKDRFIVREPSSEGVIEWGEINRPIEPAVFEALRTRVQAYLQGRELYVTDCHAGADERYRVPIRVISEKPTGALFARIMFLGELNTPGEIEREPGFTVVHVPDFHADPRVDGTRSEAFILLHLGAGLVLIGGTAYAGEIKKSIFTVMNYLLPGQGVLPMHCSANYGPDRYDVSLFFGLSGTGKTTLSAESSRILIGDDEHGWTDRGVFNFEGGCYAKAIRLSREREPEIYAATKQFGSLLENVVVDRETRQLDLDDATLTENTRVAYPITHIPNMERKGQGGHPSHIFMLTADAFGVLPPIARLTTEQAMFHFLSGYTAKVAGTETGVTEPQAVFSACFGAPFMPRHPKVYADMLGERIVKQGTEVWLVNTGWTGGGPGEGDRIKLRYTRAMLEAARSGELDDVEMREDPIFGIAVPTVCPGVPSEVLNPRDTWKDPEAYDAKALELAEMFRENYRERTGG